MTPYTRQLLLVVAVSLFVMSVGLMIYMSGLHRLIEPPPFDGRVFGYDAAVVDAMLNVWTPDQVATYRWMHLGPDMLFPWVYTGFFLSAAALGFGCAFPDRKLWPFLLVLPLLNLAADYGENYLISFVILPAGAPSDPTVVGWASRLTVAKWGLVLLNILLVGAGILCNLFVGPTPQGPAE